MMNNIIGRQRFILSSTKESYIKELTQNQIVDTDIIFITKNGDKDICTHGVFMLDEIKEDVSDLKIRVTAAEVAISKLKSDVTNINNEITNIKNDIIQKHKSITNQISAITSTAVTIKIAAKLPNKSDADDHTIYLIPSEDGIGNNLYTEYILQNGNWEVVGMQKSDISFEDYYTKAQIDSYLNNKSNVAHNHTVSDITNFPTFKTINGQSITGSGNITVSAPDVDLSNYYTKQQCDDKYLTTHQQLKTINGQSLVGSGNIVISGESTGDQYWTLNNNTLSPINSQHEVSAKTFYASSDINLKENISNIDQEEIDKLDKINLVEYNFKDDSIKHYGVIAQNIEEAGLNDLVNITDGVKSVDYQSLTILYIKKLENEINTLKFKLSEYEKKNSNEK